MDYEKFKKDLEEYDSWDRISQNPRSTNFPSLDKDSIFAAGPVPFHLNDDVFISVSTKSMTRLIALLITHVAHRKLSTLLKRQFKMHLM